MLVLVPDKANYQTFDWYDILSKCNQQNLVLLSVVIKGVPIPWHAGLLWGLMEHLWVCLSCVDSVLLQSAAHSVNNMHTVK